MAVYLRPGDEDVLVAYTRGGAAFRDVARVVRPRLVAYAERRLVRVARVAPLASADDAAQLMLIAVWRALDTFDATRAEGDIGRAVARRCVCVAESALISYLRALHVSRARASVEVRDDDFAATDDDARWAVELDDVLGRVEDPQLVDLIRVATRTGAAKLGELVEDIASDEMMRARYGIRTEESALKWCRATQARARRNGSARALVI